MTIRRFTKKNMENNFLFLFYSGGKFQYKHYLTENRIEWNNKRNETKTEASIGQQQSASLLVVGECFLSLAPHTKYLHR